MNIRNFYLLFPIVCMLPGCIFSQGLDQPYWEETVDFRFEGKKISGKLIVPRQKAESKWPVILFVHGSGPEDYSSSGNYTYLWEQFTRAGYACYSWDRPGVGESEGKWYEMDIAGRAGEVLAAVRKLETLPQVNPREIGFWGLSQAGWVISQVAEVYDPAFVISVSSPVTTISDQELHRVRSEMAAEGFTEPDIRDALAYTGNYMDLIQRNQPFPDFAALQESVRDAPWGDHVIKGDEVVFSYLKVLLKEDNIPTYKLRCPVLAIWGANDLVVPPKKSAAAFKLRMEEAGNRNCTIAIINNADHTLTYNLSGRRSETIRRREEYQQEPEKQFAPGYVAAMTGWLMNLESSFP